MRTSLHSNSECIHIWAGQTQNKGKAGNVSFEGGTLMSYGTPIATIVEDKGRQAVLHSTTKWSVTTSAHQREAQRAAQHYPSFHVDMLPCYGVINHSTNMTDYARRYGVALQVLYTCRSHYQYRESAVQAVREEAERYATFFDVDVDDSTFPPIDEVQAGRARLRAQRHDDARQHAYASSQALRSQPLDAQIAAFRAGTRRTVDSRTVYLRVRGAVVETSYGVKFPDVDARRAWPLIRRCQHAGISLAIPASQPVRLGQYRIDQVDADGTVHAGCHTVTYDEIERTAIALGL